MLDDRSEGFSLISGLTDVVLFLIERYARVFNTNRVVVVNVHIRSGATLRITSFQPIQPPSRSRDLIIRSNANAAQRHNLSFSNDFIMTCGQYWTLLWSRQHFFLGDFENKRVQCRSLRGLMYYAISKFCVCLQIFSFSLQNLFTRLSPYHDLHTFLSPHLSQLPKLP